MTKFCKRVGSVLLILAAPNSWAAEAAVQEPPVGAATRGWLQLQVSGSASDGREMPIPGEVADAMYQRYLQSFSHPIPEQFKSEDRSGASQSVPAASSGE